MNYREHYKIDALEFDYWGADQFSPTEPRRNQTIYALCNIKPDDRILDIGSGRGWFSMHAASLGAEVTALDLSEANLQKINSANPAILTLYGDACEIPESAGKFDLIVAVEVLEHLVDPAKAVRNWKLLLKPEGRLVLTVPYKEIIRYTLCIHCNHKTPVNAHLHSFDRDAVVKLLNHNGFWVKQNLLFLHRFLVTFRLNQLLKWLPYNWWKRLDRLCRLLGDKYGFIAVTAILKQ